MGCRTRLRTWKRLCTDSGPAGFVVQYTHLVQGALSMKVLGGVCLAALLSLTVVGIIAMAKPSGSGYHLVKSVPIGPAPGDAEYFDYVTIDLSARHVHIAHGAEVKLVDADNYF